MKALPLLTLAVALALTGCGGDNDSNASRSNTNDTTGNQNNDQNNDQSNDQTTDQPDVRTGQVDTNDGYVYVNLITGEVLAITDEQAATSSDWHIGFSRTTVVLNGGSSGPGAVTGALAAAQDQYYLADGSINNSVFLNADADNELNVLLADYDLSTFTFDADKKVPAIEGTGAMTGTLLDMGWFNYDVASHQLSLNADNWWLVKSSTGDSFAKVHATAFNYDSDAGLSATFAFDVQPAGAASFTTTATFAATVPASGGEACFDFDTDTNVACSSDAWDVMLAVDGRDFALWTNGGVTASGDGGAFGPLPTETADLYVSGTTSSTGGDVSDHYQADKSSGVFKDNAWYAYNLEGNHGIWPNYRVYLIDTDANDDSSPVFALQMIGYYSDTGASRHPMFRYVAQ